MSRRTDPIKRIELADGRVRYRFVVDVGEKPRLDDNGVPVRDAAGRQVMMRDQRTFTLDKLTEARTERALNPGDAEDEDVAEGIVEEAWLAVRRKEVREALALLPPDQRDAVEMAYFQHARRLASTTARP